VSQSSTVSSGDGKRSISGGWVDHSTPRPSPTGPSPPQTLPHPPIPVTNSPVVDPPPVDNQPPRKNSEATLLNGAPPVIPKEHTNRTLVLCFDGTGDQFDDDVSHFRTYSLSI
jgi:hypothetical protein